MLKQEKQLTKRTENKAFADQTMDHLGNDLVQTKSMNAPDWNSTLQNPIQKKDDEAADASNKSQSKSEEQQEKEKEKEQEMELEILVDQLVEEELEKEAMEKEMEEEMMAQQMAEQEQMEAAQDGDQAPAQMKKGAGYDEDETKRLNQPSPFQLKSSKTSLPDEVRGKMESAFKTDFSAVQLHQDSAHATSIGAKAYTQGSEVHFAPGEFEPYSQKGQSLIGHELSHVIQQSKGGVKSNKQLGDVAINDQNHLENEADKHGELAASGQSVDGGNHDFSSISSDSDTLQGKFIKEVGGLSKDDSSWYQEMIEGAIYGDLIEDGDKNWKNIVGQVVMGFVPYAGQVADIRDIGVALNNMGDGGWKEGGNWLNLGLSVVGVIPGLGDGVKALKHVPWGKLGKFLSKNAGKLWDGVKGAGKWAAKHGGKIWDGVKSGAGNAWKGIKSGAGSLWKGIKGAGGWASKKAGEAWGGVKSAAGSAWNGIKGAGSWLGGKAKGAWNGIKSGAGQAWEGIKGAGSRLGGMAKGAWDGIKTGAGNIWKGIGGAGSRLGDMAKGVWGGIKSGAGSIWDGIKGAGSRLGGMAKGAWGGIKSGAGSIWKGIKGAGSRLGGMAKGAWGGIKSGAGSIWKGIKGAGSSLGGMAKGAWNSVKSGAGKAWNGIKGAGSWLGGKAKGAWDGIKGGAKWLGSKAKKTASWAGKKIGNAYNKYIQSPVGKIDTWINKKIAPFKPVIGYAKEKIKEKGTEIKEAFKSGASKVKDTFSSGVSKAKSFAEKLKFW